MEDNKKNPKEKVSPETDSDQDRSLEEQKLQEHSHREGGKPPVTKRDERDDESEDEYDDEENDVEESESDNTETGERL